MAPLCVLKAFQIINIGAFGIKIRQLSYEWSISIVPCRLQSSSLELSNNSNLMPSRDQSLDVYMKSVHGYASGRKAVEVRLCRMLIISIFSWYADNAQLLRSDSGIFPEESELISHLYHQQSVHICRLDIDDLLFHWCQLVYSLSS